VTRQVRFEVVDDILAAHASVLGADATGYGNHVYRGLHYFAALAGGDVEPPASVLVAAAFHDLGIWTERTFDYLEPSTRAALAYLSSRGLDALIPEVAALIAEHHKLRVYRGPHARNVELFRRADLADLSLGIVRSGLPAGLVRSVKAAFPDAGFHARLLALAASQFLKHPLRPLPMVHW
jgi:predicted metal-dependent HD superfamily phosphohydrolase